VHRLDKMKWIGGSLFFRLLSSFLAVIFIFTLFNVFTFIYLKNRILDEIIVYNNQDIDHTVQGYEHHFRLAQSTIASLNQSDKWISDLNALRHVKANNSYERALDIQSEIKLLYANPFLHIENFILYFRNDAYVLEKEGTSSAADMFGKFYASSDYPPAFWERQFDDPAAFRILPASEFKENYMHLQKSRGLLLPVLVKPFAYSDLYYIVLFDARKLQETYHSSSLHSFFILDDEGRTVFASHSGGPDTDADSDAPADAGAWPAFGGGSGYVHADGHYYFYKQGDVTGFTYVSKVPVASVTSQLIKLNLVLIVLLVVAVAIGISTSVLFTVRFNNPVRRLLDSFQKQEPGMLPREPIREFNLLGQWVSDMWQTNRDIRDDLVRKTSLLRYYAYTNKLKNIHMNFAELQELVDIAKPFRFVLHRVTFKTDSPLLVDQERAMYYIRELIDSTLVLAFPESFTFQIEHDLVLSLVYAEGEPSEDALMDRLEQLKQVLDVDLERIVLTIAVSDVYRDSAAFRQAFEQASAMLGQRRLRDGTQIIRKLEPERKRIVLTAADEEELHTKLMSGSESAVMDWVVRRLDKADRSGALEREYAALASDVAKLVEKSVIRLQLHEAYEQSRHDSAAPVHSFHSREQYEQWFRQLFAPALQLIASRSQTRDPITDFVLSYVDSHLSEDISLDLLADKLNLTPGYLSTYFKDKTGRNFSDYLNETRMSRAKRLLREPERRIQDVAAEVGYRNVNSFIRTFKKFAGMTPGEYRKKGWDLP